METSGVTYGHIVKEQILDFPGKINGCPSSRVERIAHAGIQGCCGWDDSGAPAVAVRAHRAPGAGEPLRYLSRSCCC